VECAGKPHGVKIIVRHHDGKFGLNHFFGDQVGNDLRGHEVSANDDIRLHLGQEPDERARVQSIKKESHPVRLPRFITFLVPPSQKGRSVLHEFDIKLGVKIPKKLVGEGQGVDMSHFRDARNLVARLFQRRRRPKVPRSGTGGEDKNFLRMLHTWLLYPNSPPFPYPNRSGVPTSLALRPFPSRGLIRAGFPEASVSTSSKPFRISSARFRTSVGSPASLAT